MTDAGTILSNGKPIPGPVHAVSAMTGRTLGENQHAVVLPGRFEDRAEEDQCPDCRTTMSP
jgi:hypothetical protein